MGTFLAGTFVGWLVTVLAPPTDTNRDASGVAAGDAATNLAVGLCDDEESDLGAGFGTMVRTKTIEFYTRYASECSDIEDQDACRDDILDDIFD